MRIENVKGAVWTVDNLEYCRRRPLKINAATSSSTSPVSSSSFKQSMGFGNDDGVELEDMDNRSNSSRKYENSDDLELEVDDEEDDEDDEEDDEDEAENDSGFSKHDSDNQENSSLFMSANENSSNNTRKLLNENNHRRKMKRLCLSSSNH